MQSLTVTTLADRLTQTAEPRHPAGMNWWTTVDSIIKSFSPNHFFIIAFNRRWSCGWPSISIFSLFTIATLNSFTSEWRQPVWPVKTPRWRKKYYNYRWASMLISERHSSVPGWDIEALDEVNLEMFREDGWCWRIKQSKIISTA